MPLPSPLRWWVKKNVSRAKKVLDTYPFFCYYINMMMKNGVNDMKTTDIKTALRNYLDHIYADYCNYFNDADEKFRTRFAEGLEFKMGKKYVKVIHNRSVHSFIVNVHDDPNFKFGDILKPASWASPAKNFARGNIFEGNFGGIRWMGA